MGLRDSLLQQGYSQDVPDEPVKKSEIPAFLGEGDWQRETPQQAPKKTYVPPALKGTEYEPYVKGITNALYSKKDQGFDIAVDLDQGKLQWALETFRDVSPDLAARVQKIATDRDKAFPEILDNQEEWQKWKEAVDIFNTLGQVDAEGKPTYPNTYRWLSDPANMAQAKDDVATLAQVEKLVKEYQQQDDTYVQKMARAASSGIANMDAGIARTPAVAYNLMALPQNILAKYVPGLGGLKAETPKFLVDNALTRYYDDLTRETAPLNLDKDMMEYVKAGDYAGAADLILTQAVQNAPNQLLLLAFAAAGAPNTGLGFMAGTSAAQATKSAIDAGKDPVNVTMDSILQGGFEAAGEQLGTMSVFKSIEKSITKEFGQTISKNVWKQVGKTLLKQVPFAMGVEGIEEFATSGAQDLSDFVTGNPEAMEGWFSRAINSFLVGALSGGAMTGPIAVFSSAAKTQQFKQNFKAWENLTNTSQQSKLRERNPAAYAQVVEQNLVQGGKDTNFYLQADVLSRYFQDEPDQFFETLKDLGVTQEQLHEAIKTGSEIPVPIAAWMAKYAGTELDVAVRGNIKFSPGGLSVSEEAQAKQEMVKLVRGMQDELQTMIGENQLPPTAEALRDKFMATKEEGGMGWSAEEADANLAVVLAAAKYFTRQTGESAEDFLKRNFGQVNIGGVAGDAGVRSKTFEQSGPDAKKEYWELTKSDFDATPFMQYVASTRKGIKGEEAIELAQRMVDEGVMSIEDANYVAQEPGFDQGVTGVANLTTGNPIPSKPVEGGMQQALSNISRWQTFRNGIEFAHLNVILRALEEGKKVPKEVLAEYIGRYNLKGEEGGSTTWAEEALLRLYPGENTEKLVAVGQEWSVAKQKLWDAAKWINGAKDVLVDREGSKNYTEFATNMDALASSKATDTKGDVNRSFGRQMKQFMQKHNLTTKEYYDIVMGEKAPPAEIVALQQKVDQLAALKDRILNAPDAEAQRQQLEYLKGELNTNQYKQDKSYAADIDRRIRAIEDQTFFQTEQVDNELVAVHNLSEDNLKHALKIGGLAVPSLAITKDKNTLESFGEITLVADKSVIDPRASKTSKVFNADVYSPRYPNVKYKLSSKGIQAAFKKLKPADLEISGHLSSDLYEGELKYKGLEPLYNSTVAKYQFLKEKGAAPEPVRVKYEPKLLPLNPEIEVHIGTYTDAYHLNEDKALKAEFDRLMAAEKARAVAEEGLTPEQANELYDEESMPHMFRQLKYEIEQKQKAARNEIDEHETRHLIDDAAQPYIEEFQQWVVDNFSDIIASEQLQDVNPKTENIRLLPHTLDNAVRIMTRRLRDGEGFNYGPASVRSKVAEQFRSIKEIREAKGNLVSDKEFEDIKNDVNNEFDELYQNHFVDHQVNAGPFGSLDAFSEHLKEVAETGRVDVLDEYYTNLTETDKQAAWTFLEKLRNMPTEYFEAKLQRGVSIDDFSAALVPDNVKPETIKALEDLGLTVVKYDRNRGVGTREKAMMQLKEQRPDLFFQEQSKPRGSVQFTDSQTILNLYKTANFSTFLHEAGHIFTHEMQILIESGQANDQTVKDYQTLVDFADGKLDRAGMEKIARAFEAYLMEGKAPSVKLAAAFQQFKDWLTAIYKSIRGLNVEISQDVRSVFDRILASEQEIREAQDYYASKKSLTDLIKPTVEQKKKLDRTRKASETAAIEKQLSRYMKAYLQAIGGRAAVRDLATREIENSPVYKAMAEAIKKGGLNLEEVQSYYGDQIVEQLRSKNMKLISGQAKPKMTSYRKTVLDMGGIDPETLSPEEIRMFKENGAGRVLKKSWFDTATGTKKGGKGLDDIAASLVNNYQMFVPDNMNPTDALRELLFNDANVPTDEWGGKGVSVSEIAAQHEFESEEELIAALTQAERKQDAISRRTDEILAEREQQIREELNRQETIPGDEALHNDKSLAYLIAEAEVLAEKIARAQESQVQRITEKIYKDAAEEIIQAKPVKLATRYDLYAKTEQKFAKQSLAAAEAGDFVAAHEAKKKQILNHALVQAAIRARDDRAEIEAGSKRLAKAPAKSVEFTNREAVLMLVSRYGLGSASMNPQRPAEVNLTNLLNEMDELGGAPPIPDWIINLQGPESYRDLTFKQLRELYDAIKAIHKNGRKDVRSLILSGILKDVAGIEKGALIEEVAGKACVAMKTLKDNHPVDEFHWFSKSQKFGREVLANIGLMNLFTKEFDAYQGLGIDGKMGLNEAIFSRSLAQADSSKKQIWDEKVKPRMEGKGDLVQGIRTAVKEIESRLGKKFVLPVPKAENEVTGQRMKQAGRNFWTAEQLLAVALNLGNEGNINALKKGFGWSDAQIKMLQSQLTAQEWQLVQSIWEFVDEFYPLMDDAYFRINDSHTTKVDALPFQVKTADGQTLALTGGYYPLMFDQQLSDRAAKQQEQDLLKNRTDAVFQNASAKSGFAIKRQGGTLPVKLDLMVLYQHLNDVIHYATHAEIIRDLDRLTRSSEWANTVRDKFGNDVYREFRESLKYVARPQAGPATWINKVATKYRKLSTLYALGYNIKSGVKQTLSFSSAAQEIGWDWARQGMETCLRNPAQAVKDVNELSSYINNRAKSIDREIQEQLKAIKPFEKRINVGGKELGMKEVQDAGFIFVQAFDAIAVYATWQGAFQKSMAENSELPFEKRKATAVGYADDIVAQTQPSSRDMDLSHWQRGEGVERILSQFMTWTLKYGHRTRAYLRGWKEGKISNKEYFRHIANEQLMPLIGAYIINKAYAMLLGRDKDDENLAAELAYTGLGQLVSGYPVLREAPSVLQYGPYRIGENPIVKGLKVYGQITWEGSQFFNESRDLGEQTAKFMQALAQAAELESGVPFLRVLRDLKSAADNLTGE